MMNLNTHPEFDAPPMTAGIEDAFDLRSVIGLILTGWHYILGAVIVCLLAALCFLFLTAPTYTADALVQVDKEKNNAQIAFAQTAEAIATEVPVAAEIEILKSRSVLGRVVDRMGLDISVIPAYFPVAGSAYARRYRGAGFGDPPWWLVPIAGNGYAWGGERVTITTLEVPPELLGVTFVLRKLEDQTFALFDVSGSSLLSGRIGEQVSAPYGEGKISIFVQELRAEPGARFHVVRMRRENAIKNLKEHLTAEEGKPAKEILKLTYAGHDPELVAKSLTEILTTYQSQNIAQKSAEAAQTLDFLSKQLPEARKLVETAEAKVNQFKVQQGTADLRQETTLILEKSVELEQARATLTQQRTEALQRFTASHPVVESIDSQIKQLESQIGRVTARVRQLPDIEQRALELSRDLTVNTALYVSLLNRTQELEVVKSGTVGTIRVIDFPIRPSVPSAPKRGLVIGFSLILGLIAGFALLAVLHMMRDGVTKPAEVERALGLVTYGAIPYSEEQVHITKLFKREKSSRGILAMSDPTSPAMEAVRSLRTALHFAQMDAPNNILMLTGPGPNLGKSFLSVNLGAVFAQAGRRVVVIDGDMRRGHLHQLLSIDRSPGLSELITGSAPMETALHATDLENLWLIPSGTIPPNPAELLIKEKFSELLQDVSKRFDLVIIDSPPVLAVTDPAIMGRHAGVTLLVLKAAEHSMRIIEEARSRLVRAGVPVRGTIFNQVGRGQMGTYGGKYGYYYAAYRYQMKKRKSLFAWWR